MVLHEQGCEYPQTRRPCDLAPISRTLVSDRMECIQIPGVVVRINRHRIRIRVWQCGRPRLVVDPDNVLFGEEAKCRINDRG